jgi:hypothetical protein
MQGGHPEYTDGMPILASKFLGGLTETDIVSIIGGLKDNIEPADQDLLEDKDHDHGYDTDEIEKKTIKKVHKNKKKKIVILDNLSDSSSPDSSSSEEEVELIVDQGLLRPTPVVNNHQFVIPAEQSSKVGGGNVLQILVSLIPSVFPKSYM